uniref:Uncharacterized protein n=1 Tax=Anguilla anguilla TaxID=7936 RepID=A0A0E9WZU5_ANGAN
MRKEEVRQVLSVFRYKYVQPKCSVMFVPTLNFTHCVTKQSQTSSFHDFKPLLVKK